MPDYKRIKVYGERNSGTNYLEKLLCLNLSLEILPGIAPWPIRIIERMTPLRENIRDLYFSSRFHSHLGWKHMCVDIDRIKESTNVHQTIFVCLVKNPYSWALSFLNNPHHYERESFNSLEELLQKEFTLTKRDHIGKSAKLIELWNLKYESYFKLQEAVPTSIMKYESLVSDPRGSLKEIAELSQHVFNVNHFTNFVKPSKGTIDKTFFEYQEYYLKENWKKKLTRNDIDLINEQLNPLVMNKLGYTYL